MFKYHMIIRFKLLILILNKETNKMSKQLTETDIIKSVV